MGLSVFTRLGILAHNPAVCSRTWHRSNLASEGFGDFVSLIFAFGIPSPQDCSVTVVLRWLLHDSHSSGNHLGCPTAVSISHLPLLHPPALSGFSSQRSIANACARFTQEFHVVGSSGIFSAFTFTDLSSLETFSSVCLLSRKSPYLDFLPISPTLLGRLGENQLDSMQTAGFYVFCGFFLLYNSK